MIHIALNGFGRIGRTFLRVLMTDPSIDKKIKLVAINLGPANPKDLVYSILYDSIMGPFIGTVTYANNILTVNKKEIIILTESDPTNLPWRSLEVDWIIDASGRFTKRIDAIKHLEAGAKNVLITAPATDEDISIIPGVNDSAYQTNHHIVSLGSCTTNALAPLLHVVQHAVGIEYASLTTIHSYTNSQVLLDVENKSIRLSRAAAINMIPSSTGATKVIGKVIPELNGKIIGNSVRIPLAKVSLIDVVMTLKKSISKDDLNHAFEQAQKGALKNILAITYEPLVSSDFGGNPHSVIIDGLLTQTNGTMAKVFGWYDNEWGYSMRLKDFLLKHAC